MFGQGHAVVVVERTAAVDGAAAHADGAVPVGTGRLDVAIKQLLHRPRAALHPGLPVGDAEELRCLHNSRLRVGVHVRQGLIEDVLPRREVGVKQQNEVAPRPLEAI
jgi:hypothetical protein